MVEALKAGDEAVFEAIYNEYSGALKAYAAVILQDSEVASEIVQDIFLMIWVNRKKLDNTKPLRNYLLRAVHNNALHAKKMSLARKIREEKAGIEQLKQWGENNEKPLEEEQLGRAIVNLPERSRKVLTMSYWEDKKNIEIANELSISVRTVETILYKVMKKLRGILKKN